jgi:hypothetical protein
MNPLPVSLNILQVKDTGGDITCPECNTALTYIESVHGWRETVISGFEINNGVRTIVLNLDESETELEGSEYDELRCINSGCPARIRIDFDATDWDTTAAPISLAWVQVCVCSDDEHTKCAPYWNIATRHANGEIDKERLT